MRVKIITKATGKVREVDLLPGQTLTIADGEQLLIPESWVVSRQGDTVVVRDPAEGATSTATVRLEDSDSGLVFADAGASQQSGLGTGALWLLGGAAGAATIALAAGGGGGGGGGGADPQDSTAPGSPIISSVSEDSGVAGDQITKDATITLTGSAEPGSRVTIFDGTIELGQVTADGNGNWTFTTSQLSDGAHQLSARATDAAGNVSVASNAVPVTVDTIPPAPGTLAVSGRDDDSDGSFTLVPTGAEPGAALVFQISTDGGNTWTPTGAAQNNLVPGTYSFRVIATDVAGNQSISNVQGVTVTTPGEANVAPVATDAAFSVSENGPTVAASVSATDADGDVLTYSVVGAAPAGLSFNSDGTFSFNPGGLYEGLDTGETAVVSFQYRASDGTLASNVATVTLTINGANDAPLAIGDAVETQRDTPLTISAAQLLSNDADIDGETLTLASVSSGVGGTAVLQGNSVLFTPTPGFVGGASFTYTVTDGTTTSNAATVSVIVGAPPPPPNAAPVAIDGSQFVGEDGPAISGNVIATDPNADSLTYTIVGDAPEGLVLNPNGSFTFNPGQNYQFLNNNQSAIVAFQFQASDGQLNSNVGTFTITVNGADEGGEGGNVAPVGNADSYSTLEDMALVVATPGVLANDSDANGDALTATLVTGPANGSLALNPNGSFTYTPTANYNGPDSFTYTVGDGLSVSSPITVSLTVTPVNDQPTFSHFTSVEVNEDAGPQTVANFATLISAGPANEAGQTLTFNVVGNSNPGLFLVAPSISADGTLTYTPAANASGSAIISLNLSDNGGTANGGIDTSNTVTFLINVVSVNDAPVGVTDVYNVTQGQLVVSAPGVLGNDTDVENTPLTATKLTDPTNGTLTFSSDGAFVYTPNFGFSGTDSFTYQASDGALNTGIVTVTLNVTTTNVAPVAVADTYAATEDTPLVVPAAAGVLPNDTDANGDTLMASLVDAPTNGALVLNGDGSFTYTPAANYNGSDSFTYRVFDGAAFSDPVTVTLNVTQVNDAGTFGGDTSGTGAEDGGPIVGTLTFADAADGFTPNYTVSTDAGAGVASINAAGAWTYTPVFSNFNGTDSFTVSVTDDDGNVETQVISLTVTQVNDAGTFGGNTSGTGAEDGGPIVGTLTFADAADGFTPNYAVTGVASNGVASINAAGAWTYTPASNFNGTDSFTVSVTDDDGNVETQVISLTVTAVDDAGVFGGNTSGTGAEDGGPIVGTLTFADAADGFTPNYTVTTVAGNGVASINAAGAWTYTPAANFNGTDSFTVSVTDDEGNVETQVISLTVTQVNDAGVFSGNTSGTGAEDGGPIVGTLTFADAADGFTPNYTVSTGAVGGVASINAAGAWTYTPAANFNGTDSFAVSVTDDDGNVETQVISLTVTQVNDAGVFSGNTSGTGAEDGGPIVGTLTFADAADGFTPNYTVSTGAVGGVASINAAGAWTYTPAANFNGTDSFTVSVTDDDGNVETQVISLTVTQVNDAGTFGGNTSGTGAEDGGPIVGTLTFADVADGFTPNYAVTTVAGNGVASINAAGAWTYTPASNFNGTDSFTVSVTDDDGNVETQVISLTVTPVNDAPVLTGDLTATVLEGGSYVLTAADLGFTDPDDVATGVTFTTTSPVNGVVQVNNVTATSFTGTQLAAGQVRFLHNGGETTTASFQVSVEDGNEDNSAPVASAFNLTVTPVNDAPVLTGDLTATVLEGGSYVLTAADLGFTDPDDVATGVTFTTTSPVNGVVQVNNVTATSFTGTQLAAGQVRFLHNGGETTTASFQVSVEDGNEDNSAPVASAFNLTVTPVNDAPVLTGDLTATVLEGGSYVLTAADLGFTDPDDVAAGVTFTTTSPVNGVVQVNNVTATSFTGTQLAAGQVRFLHNGGETTTASFQVSVEDGNEDNSAPVASAFNLTVTPVNDAPVATPDLIYVTDNTDISVPVSWFLANDTDAEGNTITFSAAALVTGGDAGIFQTAPTYNAGTGLITFRAVAGTANDGTTTRTGTITYQIADNGTPAGNGSGTITVRWVDVGTEDTNPDNYSVPAGAYQGAYLNMGAGNDTVNGGSADDIILGGTGTDTINGGGGNDTIDAGEDNDTIIGEQNDLVINGGNGTDTLNVGAAFTSTSNTQIINIENVLLTAAVTLNLANQTEGFTITGSAGADSITGGAGNDTIVGAQNDTLLNGFGGTDTLNIGAAFTSTGDGQLVNIENILLTAAATLNLSNQTEAFSIVGSGGIDTITGGSGADSIDAGVGNDTIVGAQNDLVLNGGNGTDTLNIGASFTATSNAQLINIENILLTAAVTLSISTQTEAFTITGSAGADSITGGSANDGIIGAQNDVLLNGGGGNDTLFVGAAFTSTSDAQIVSIEVISLTAAANVNFANQTEALTINGSAFNDTIRGGSGNDTLDGGAGSDTYQLALTSAANGVDSITFTAGNGADILSLAGLVSSGVEADGGAFNGTITASTNASNNDVNVSGRVALFNAGGNNNAAVDTAAEIVAFLNSNDFNINANSTAVIIAGSTGNAAQNETAYVYVITNGNNTTVEAGEVSLFATLSLGNNNDISDFHATNFVFA